MAAAAMGSWAFLKILLFLATFACRTAQTPLQGSELSVTSPNLAGNFDKEHYTADSDGSVVYDVHLQELAGSDHRKNNEPLFASLEYDVQHRDDRTTWTNTHNTPPLLSTTTEESSGEEEGDALTTWSIAWYLTLLAAFVVFFVLIGLLEVCCRRRRFPFCAGVGSRDSDRVTADSTPDAVLAERGGPPPPYELFKPPSYSTLFPPDTTKLPEKQQPEEAVAPVPCANQLVYVINIHGGRGIS